jgi:hypothetical protein
MNMVSCVACWLNSVVKRCWGAWSDEEISWLLDEAKDAYQRSRN